MENKLFKYSLAALALAVPLAASANLIWPSLFIVETYYTWYIILGGLIIETIAAKIFLKASWLKSLGMMAATNAISALVGVLFIPLSGITVELLTLPFGGSTFDVSHVVLDYICAVLVNTIVEGLALEWIFKYKLSRNFWWLFGANAISVIASVAVCYLTNKPI